STAALLGLSLNLLMLAGCGGSPQLTQANNTTIKAQTGHFRADGGSGDEPSSRGRGGAGGGGGSGSDGSGSVGSGGSGGGTGWGGGNCGTGLADFYVATNGNDSWSGTLDAPNGDSSDGPFATLNRARQAVQGMTGGK